MQYRLEQLGNFLQKTEAKMLVALLLVIILGMGYKTIIVPQQNELKKKELTTQQNTEALTAYQTEKAQLTSRLNDPSIKQTLKNVTRALPPDVRFDTELLRLGPIIRNSGVDDQSIQPGGITLKSPVSAFGISITVTGSTQEMIKFLRLLRRQVVIRNNKVKASGPIWIIKSVTIGGEGASGQSSSIQAIILFKSPQEETQAAPSQ